MSLKRLFLFKIGNSQLELPKLIGAFLIIIAVLMLVKSGAVMFDSWQSVRDFDECITNAVNYADDASVSPSVDYMVSELKVHECKNSLYQITGAQVPGGVYNLTQRQAWTAVLGPIVQFFSWAVVFLFALFLFNNGSVVVPIEQVELPIRSFNKKRK
jgi:hypothetical protein